MKQDILRWLRQANTQIELVQGDQRALATGVLLPVRQDSGKEYPAHTPTGTWDCSRFNAYFVFHGQPLPEADWLIGGNKRSRIAGLMAIELLDCWQAKLQEVSDEPTS